MLHYPGLTRGTLLCVLIVILQLIFSNQLKAQKSEHVHAGMLRIKVSEAMARQLEKSSLKKNKDNVVATGIEKFDDVSRKFKVTSMKRVFPYAGKFEAKHRKYGLHLWYEVEIDKSIPIHQAIPGFKSIAELEIVEPVYKKQFVGASNPDFGPVTTKPIVAGTLPNGTNDPMLGSQWHYNNTGQTGGTIGADISLFDAWNIETGSPNVVVAIEDGGIDLSHEDLAANLWVNSDEIPNNGADDDGNGYVDDYNGYSFVDHSGNISAHDHGTHVAGTVAAVNNNGVGVAGVAGGSGTGDGVRLMSCAVFSYWGGADGFAQAFIYSADNGAVISQNSWSYTSPDYIEQAILDGIDYFIAEAGKDEFGNQNGPMNGGIVIFAAANNNSNANYWPAVYEPVLSVASTNHVDAKSWYSNFGYWVDIAAPGGETDIYERGVLSTLPSNQYGYYQGTSMACPHVSGAAALVVSQMGGTGFSPALLRERLVQTTDNIDASNPSYIGQLGTGRLTVANALVNEDDGLPPTGVYDLAASSPSLHSITLSWSAPSDGSRSAFAYDLKISDQPITEENFSAAQSVSGTPSPKSPGSAESFTVANLNAGTSYYFAINSRDYHGNTSVISNVAQGTTLFPPVIEVAPLELTADLVTAASDTLVFTISNSGVTELIYSIGDSDSLGRVAVEAQTGTVQPSTSTNVNVFVNASGLLAGQYGYNIFISSNDPVTPAVNVPVILNVSNNGLPIASISTNVLDFGKVMLNRSKSLGVLIKNEGSDPLEIQSSTINPASFSSDLDGLVSLAAFESRIITVTFNPTDAGSVASTFVINTNDAANFQILIQLAGEGVEAPVVSVQPMQIDFTAYQNHTEYAYLAIANNGGSALFWKLKEDPSSDSLSGFSAVQKLSTLTNTTDAGAFQASSNVFASRTNVEIKANGLSQKPVRVLILSPDPDVNDVASILSQYPDLQVGSTQPQWVDIWTLLYYDVVVLTNNYSWNSNGGDPEKIGNLLADYVDAGGKVITHQMSYSSFPEYQLKGRFVNENYAPFTMSTAGVSGFVNLGQVLDPAHPLMASVNFLQYNGYTGNVGVAPGSTALANWDNGSVFLAANDNVVGLNLLPSSGYGGFLDWSGDLPLLWHNAINYLVAPAPTYLNLDFFAGIVDPHATWNGIRIRLDATGMEPGTYHTKVKLYSNDPKNNVVEIPVSMTILANQFVSSPDSIVANLYRGQSKNEVVSITHNGTQSHIYDITVEPYGVQSVAALARSQGFDVKKNKAPEINPELYREFAMKLSSAKEVNLSSSDLKKITLPPLPAVLNTVYGTDFEDFALGDLNQNGWYTYYGWVVDTTNAFSGDKHIREIAGDGSDFAFAISPYMSNGPSAFSSTSVRLNLQGSGGDLHVVPISSNGQMNSTEVLFSSYGGIGVYESNGDGSYLRWLNMTWPAGYFDLTVESNEVTGDFYVYIDNQKIWTGHGHKGNAASVVFFATYGTGSNFSIDIDDVRLYDGKKFNGLPQFVDITPMSGTISPQETLNLNVLLKTDSIPAGTYMADINFFADQDAVTIPVIMNYAGSQLTINPSTLDVELLADKTTTANFVIVNGGAGDVPVTISAVLTGVTTLSGNTVAAQADVLNKHNVALRTKPAGEKNSVLPALITDATVVSPTAALYGTGFEEFNRGSLQQFNWQANENCIIDTANASDGLQHARLQAQSGGWTYAVSPAVSAGSEMKSSLSLDIDISGTVYYSNVSVYSMSRLVTDIAFSNNEIYVLTYMGNDTYQTVRVYEQIPTSFFNLAVEIDKATSQFNIRMDGRVIFTGQGGDNYVSFTYFGVGGESGGNVDVDNFQIFDGGLSDAPDFLSFEPDSGIVPSGGSLEIAANIVAPSSAGQYHINILVNDGSDEKILPLTLTVKKPQVRVTPEFLYQEQAVGQVSNQYLYMENIGTASVDYEIVVKPNGIISALAQMEKNKMAPGRMNIQPSSPRPFREVSQQLLSNPNLKIDASLFSFGKIETAADSTATLYATSFEEFELGNAAQQGWINYGKPWIVSDLMPATGEKHLSMHLTPYEEYQGNLLSPYVAAGSSSSVTSSTKIRLSRKDLSFWVIAHAPTTGSTSVMLYHYNGTVYVYSNQGFQQTQIQIPDGYFDLTFQVNRYTSKLGIFINQQSVFNGYAASNEIGLMEYIAANDFGVDGYIDIDDVQITDGSVFRNPPLTVTPSAGTLYPYYSTYLTATFDSEGLTKGMYLADIEVKVSGSTIKTIPTTLNVVGLPEIQVTPSAHDVQADYHGQEWRNITIGNPGGQTLYFNLGIEDPEVIASANTPVAKTSRDDARTMIKLEEDKKLSTKVGTQATKPVTIVVGKTMSAEQFESGVPPFQWTVVNNTGTGPQWNTASSFGEGNYSYSGEAATVSSDAFGSAPLNTELISPLYDVSGYTDITLQFYANYQNYGSRDFLDLDIRVNGEGEWKTVLKWNEDHGGFRSWGEFVSVNLDYVLAGAASFQVRWHYYDSNPGAYDWYAQIDNVSVIAQSLPWLTLNQSWGWVEPGSEMVIPMFMDGSMLPSGTFAKVIKVYSNAVNAPMIDVPVSLTLHTAPDLVFEPDTIIARQYINTTSQRQATMSNNGESVLDFAFIGHHAPAVAKNDVSKIYPDSYVVDKFVKDTRVGHPVLTGQGGPDDGGYSWIDSKSAGGPVFSWQDIRYSGTYVSLGDDDSKLVSLPFAFPFYNDVYTQLRIGSNGYLTFGEVGWALGNTELPNNYEPNNIIAALWDDLLPGAGGSVTYQSFEDRFIIQYTDVPYYYSTGSPNTFQIILNRNGDILLQYLNVNNFSNSTTGIENSTGSTGLQVAFNTNYVSNNHAILFSNSSSGWLRVSPVSGTIGGHSSINASVEIATDGLAVGTYEADLVISSNDSNEPMKFVPVELTVFDNYAPIIDSVNDVSVIETQSASLTITAHDVDDPQVSLSIINKPAFVSLTSTGNGIATYSIKPSIGNKGFYTLTVEAIDGRGLKTYRNFQLQVVPYGVENFSLIDKRNGQVILNFAGSISLNKANSAYPYYQIRANTNPSSVGSVQFFINGKSVRGSTAPPYLLVDSELKNFKVGSYTIKATAYTLKLNKGQVGSSAEALITVVNQTVTGSNVGASALTVSPNPVEREMRVSVSGDLSGESEIVMHDGTGYPVYKARVTFEQMDELRIDVSSLRPGIYYLQVTDAQGQRVTTRMVKQ